jgi:hypothetical protein
VFNDGASFVLETVTGSTAPPRIATLTVAVLSLAAVAGVGVRTL